jgi:hypothetical protein
MENCCEGDGGWFGGVFDGAELFVNLCEKRAQTHALILSISKASSKRCRNRRIGASSKGRRLIPQSWQHHRDKRAADKGEKEHHQWDRRGLRRQ